MFYSQTSSPTSPTDVNLREFSISLNTTLVWPFAGLDSVNIIARVMIVTATVSSLSLLLPPANQGQLGYTTMLINIGSNIFSIEDNSGNIVDTIAPGAVKIIALRTQADAAGTWLSYTLGATTSSADAALLAGFGLKAITTTLNSDLPSINVNASQSFNSNNRAQAAVWTGGAGVATFNLSSSLGNGWWMAFRNAGSGALTLTPTSPDMINGAVSIALNPTDSCLVICTGTTLYTIGIGRSTTVSDSQLVKNVAGNTDITLTSSEYANNVINFVGALTGNINVIFPNVVKNYWLSNSTTGAYTLTAKTSAGTGFAIPQSGSAVVTCDGTNIISANTSNSGTVTSITAGTGLSGGAITTSGTIALANTAVVAGTYGDATHFPSFTVDGQGRLTAAGVVSLGSYLQSANNLSDVANAATALSNLSGAPLASPHFTGVPTAPTAAGSDSSSQLANTAWVKSLGYRTSGVVLQIVDNLDPTYASGSTTIPYDDSIPQNTEGQEFLPAATAITPINASSKLLIEVWAWVANSGTGKYIAALFVDSTASAIMAGVQSSPATDSPVLICFSYLVSAASTTARTYKLRYGSGSAGTMSINGAAGARKLGGVMQSGIRVTEILI